MNLEGIPEPRKSEILEIKSQWVEIADMMEQSIPNYQRMDDEFYDVVACGLWIMKNGTEEMKRELKRELDEACAEINETPDRF